MQPAPSAPHRNILADQIGRIRFAMIMDVMTFTIPGFVAFYFGYLDLDLWELALAGKIVFWLCLFLLIFSFLIRRSLK